MEQVEKLYLKLKNENSKKTRDIFKDVVIIDGAMLEKDLDHKEEVFEEIESKYYIRLSRLKYLVFKRKVQEKLDEYVESSRKDINTLLGLLKVFLTRICAIENSFGSEVENLLEKIYNEDRYEKLNKLYEKLDNLLTEDIKE